MKILKLFILLVIVTLKVTAGELETTLDSANSAYAKNDFAKAIKLYESIIATDHEAPELYFNLGNAHFKNNNIPLAILNYERAKKLKPDDEDIDFNLRMAAQHTVDKIESLPPLFISEWKQGFINLLSEKGWAICNIIFFFIGLLFIALYIISRRVALKQLYFSFATIFMITSFATFFIARANYNISRNQGEAIIISTNITAKGSPNEKGTDLFVLHEGTKVTVVQNSGDWSEVKLSNGNTGWLPSSAFIVI